MKHRLVAACGLIVWVCVAPTLALNVDRDTVKIRAVEPPRVNVAELRYDDLVAEVAFGEITLGEAKLRTTKSWCVHEDSKNKLKDAVELPTHYFEVPYRAKSGILIVRDGDGNAVYSASLDSLESSGRFGYDRCAYILEAPLRNDFGLQHGSFEAGLRKGVEETFSRIAKQEMEYALFFNELVERVPLYRFKHKQHDYSDLNRATELARQGYEAGYAGESDLAQAAEIWDTALEEAELGNPKARINRKVAVKVHESLGVARLTLGDAAAAYTHLEKAGRYATMTTSRSGGTGTANLMERARERKQRSESNPDLPHDPAELEALAATIEPYRGRIPVRVLPQSALARLAEEHIAGKAVTLVDILAEQKAEQQAAVEAGENPYERMVDNSAMQGFFLFLMPFQGKLEQFPDRVTELDYLNQLRMPNHGFAEVPESIGNLASLKFLDLSGNNIERLPDSIGNLSNLKTLKLKGNPLAEGEVERLRGLLPGCKIKS